MANDTCILLGSGGWMPTSERETAALYLRRGDHVLLVDAGTGLHRLVEHPELLQGAERVDIVLTHFHLDHVIGLSYLPGLALTEKPFVWARGKRSTTLRPETFSHGSSALRSSRPRSRS